MVTVEGHVEELVGTVDEIRSKNIWQKKSFDWNANAERPLEKLGRC
jgi:hypothetical protein